MKKTFFNILIIIIISEIGAYAQLTETSVDFNPKLKYSKKTITHKADKININDTIELPFFDDFSERGIYPVSRNWIDCNVFINNQYCDTPVFVGVATFDCLNKNGEIYSKANSFTFVADTLVSRNINLDYQVSDSVYFSFYYQPQGLAYDPPETRDSLVLKFKVPGTDNWNSVWHHAGERNKPFEKVMIPITDTAYLKKGFQFQFLNYASVSSDNRSSNGDYWNIDLVYIDTARSINDTIIPDVGFVTTPGSYLKDYYSIPCSHFNTSMDAKENNQSYRNTADETIGFDRILYSKPSNSSIIEERNVGGSEDLPAHTYEQHHFTYFETIFNTVHFIGEDSLTFKVESVLHLNQGVSGAYLWNDTAHFTQTFYNYYAYDDGTAEAGIGMDGLNSAGGMLAVKFYTLKEDTLQAVKFWFNRTNKDATKDLAFDLLIWDNNNGKPGNIIYEQDNQFVTYGNGLDNYVNYIIDEPFLLSDTFFVGFRQNHEEYMNLGFDKNNDSHDKTFYSFGTWEQSYNTGSLMIRPVFGKRIPINVNEVNISFNVNIYPNPAKNHTIIKSDFRIKSIDIYNITGIKMLSLSNCNKNNTRIDTRNFTNGIYIVKITDFNNNSVERKLLIH